MGKISLRCEIHTNWSAREDGTCKRTFCADQYKEGCKCKKRKRRKAVVKTDNDEKLEFKLIPVSSF